MPWPRDHKEQVRRKIVEAAAAALRRGGVAGMSVEDVMTSAGLTHGAFYAHFDSKDELVCEALEFAAAQTVERFEKELSPLRDDARFAAFVGAYLSAQHAAHPEVGCPVAALAPELTRTAGKTKRTLADGIRGRLEWMRALLPRRLRGEHEDDVLLGTFACMVGAVVLARAVGKDESDAVLDHARRFIERAIRRGT